MYRIIGGDKKEYGPVSADDLRRWVAEGRLNAQSLVQADGSSEWKPLASFPEFADLVAAVPPLAGAPPPYAAAGLPPDIFSRDYDLDIGQCIAGGWELLKNNFGLVFGGCAVFLLIQFGLGMLGQIPFLGILISLGSFIVTGPLTGGLYYLVLKVIRRQPAEIGDVFAGFRLCFGQLLLGYLVTAILTGLAALPGVAMMAGPIFIMVKHEAVEVGPLLLAMLGLIVAAVPAIYLSIGWMFSLPLIIDKQMEFWPAMGASRKLVGKHWWLVLGLVVVCGLVNLAGFAACCIGIFISLPIVFGAMLYAYESIFSAPAGRTA